MALRKSLQSADPGPNRVDIHVGAQVRSRRKILGLTQEALAHSIGLTFQQVQKYERGANRISASKLYDIAMVLKTKPGRFFDGLDDEHISTVKKDGNLAINAFLMTNEGVELAQAFPKIKRHAVRRRILELVRAVRDDALI